MKPLDSCVVLAIVGAAFSWSPAAFGQTPSETEIREADRRFEEGKDLFEKGQFGDAHVKFVQACSAHRTKNCPKNLGLCEYELKDYAQASRHLREYLHAGDHDAATPRIQKMYDEAYAQSGHIDLAASGGAEVFVDQVSVGKAPLSEAIDVSPGKHVVEARGEKAARRELCEAAAGKTTKLDLTETPGAPVGSAGHIDPVTPPPAETPHTKSWPPPTHAMILGGVGIVAAGVGIAFLADGSSKRTALDSGMTGVCVDMQSAACATRQDAISSQHTSTTVGIVSTTVGAVAIGAALVTWIVWPRTSTGPASGRLTPSLDPIHHGGGAAYTFRF